MAESDLLQIKVAIHATPVMVEKQPAQANGQPATTFSDGNDFEIYADAMINYDALAAILNQHLPHKRFSIAEGIFKRYIVLQNCNLYGDGMKKMFIEANFSGSYSGTFYFSGIPSYNEASQTIEIQNLHYNLKTNNWLLKTAKWLFHQRIADELKKRTRFPVAALYKTVSEKLNSGLNKDWGNGMASEGRINALTVTEIHSLKDHLLLRCRCNGNLVIKIELYKTICPSS